MSHKKKNVKERPTWAPFFERKTKTLKEKKESIDKKHKKRYNNYTD